MSRFNTLLRIIRDPTLIGHQRAEGVDGHLAVHSLEGMDIRAINPPYRLL
jgi:hypothetical protein